MRWRSRVSGVILAAAAAVGGVPAWAQRAAARPSPVFRLLLEDPDARTRAEAALTLATLHPPGSRQALETALGDPAAAVRAACAASLGSLGDPAAVPALRARVTDVDPDARAAIERALAALLDAPDWSSTRFLVGAGALSDAAESDPRHVEILRDAIGPALRAQAGIAVRPGFVPPAAEVRIRRGTLPTYSIDGSVRTLTRTPFDGGLSVRAEVSLVLVAEPRHAIIGMLTGAATARQPGVAASPEHRAELDSIAIRSAVQGALRDLGTTLAAVPH